MSIIQLPLPISANTGVIPNIKTMTVTDSLAVLTTANYLNHINLQGYTVGPNDVLHVFYNYNLQTQRGDFGIFNVVLNNGVITLTEDVTSSEVTYTAPSIANHIAVFTNTTGNVSDNAATAINGGNIQAGLSGTAGTLASFPGTALKGSLKLVGVANTGDTVTTISNAPMGQASVMSIPDPATATANFAIAPASLVNNNLVKASGTAGLVADAGIAASNVQLKTDVKAGTTGNIGGAGAGPITVTVAGLTVASVVVASIATSSNTVAVAKAVAGSGNFVVTFTGDPGATCTLNYVAYIVSQ